MKDYTNLKPKEIKEKLVEAFCALLLNKEQAFYDQDLYLRVLEEALIEVFAKTPLNEKNKTTLTGDLDHETIKSITKDLQTSIMRGVEQAVKISTKFDIKNKSRYDA